MKRKTQRKEKKQKEDEVERDYHTMDYDDFIRKHHSERIVRLYKDWLVGNEVVKIVITNPDTMEGYCKKKHEWWEPITLQTLKEKLEWYPSTALREWNVVVVIYRPFFQVTMLNDVTLYRKEFVREDDCSVSIFYEDYCKLPPEEQIHYKMSKKDVRHVEYDMPVYYDYEAILEDIRNTCVPTTCFSHLPLAYDEYVLIEKKTQHYVRLSASTFSIVPFDEEVHNHAVVCTNQHQQPIALVKNVSISIVDRIFHELFVSTGVLEEFRDLIRHLLIAPSKQNIVFFDPPPHYVTSIAEQMLNNVTLQPSILDFEDFCNASDTSHVRCVVVKKEDAKILNAMGNRTCKCVILQLSSKKETDNVYNLNALDIFLNTYRMEILQHILEVATYTEQTLDLQVPFPDILLENHLLWNHFLKWCSCDEKKTIRFV